MPCDNPFLSYWIWWIRYGENPHFYHSFWIISNWASNFAWNIEFPAYSHQKFHPNQLSLFWTGFRRTLIVFLQANSSKYYAMRPAHSVSLDIFIHSSPKTQEKIHHIFHEFSTRKNRWKIDENSKWKNKQFALCFVRALQ